MLAVKSGGLVIGAGFILTLLGMTPALACGGTVTVTKSGQRVLVQGDAAPNCIEVNAFDGVLEIDGREGTVVNGNSTVIVGTSWIVLRMRAGADEVYMLEVDTPDVRWIVDTQRGNDFAGVGKAFDARQLRVDMGRDEDQVDLEGSIDVAMRSRVDGGQDDDSLRIAVVQALNVTGRLDLRSFESLVSLGPDGDAPN